MYERKPDGALEAQLITLASSETPCPAGTQYAEWSLRLLADQLVELEIVYEISYQTVHRTLKRTSSSPT